jgi:pimeloyl-ACP methyl ester carboxylesterase
MMLIKKATAHLHKIKEYGTPWAIIFIHGYLGHPLDTWRKNKNCPSFPELIIQDPSLNCIDVYSFEYKTGYFGLYYDFNDIAELLCSAVNAHLAEKKELVIISHSQGGIVAQQFVIKLAERKEPTIAKIKGVIYLAVPFEGALLGKIGGFFNRQAGAIGLYSNPLKKLKAKWLKLHDDFCFEQAILYGSHDMVVNENSANPSHMQGAKVHRFMVDLDHTDICKIDSDSTVFALTKQLLANTMLVPIKEKSYMVVWVQSIGTPVFPEDPYTVLNWSDCVNFATSPRTLPLQEIWEKRIFVDIDRVVLEWEKNWAKKRAPIRIYAKCLLSIGFVIGHRFPITKGVTLEVDHYGQLWRSDQFDPDFSIEILNMEGNDDRSEAAVVVLSITKDIQLGVLNYISQQAEFSYRVFTNIRSVIGIGHECIKTDGQAVAYACAVKKQFEELNSQGIKNVHLFMSLPLSLAFFIGHRLTGVCPIQIYEYDSQGYRPICKI